MTNGIKPDNAFILAYRFMDDGRPYLDKQLTWRERDVETNWWQIISLLSTNDEVLIIQADDYFNIMTSKPADWQELHNQLRSYSIQLSKGANA